MNFKENTDTLSQEEIKEIRNLSRWYNKIGFEYDSIPEEKRDYEKAIAFLERAEKDLKSAEILFNENQFEDSVFHIQQSVEKTGKSILIVSGMCDEKELRKKMSHEFVSYLLRKIRELLASFVDHTSDKIYQKIVKKIDEFLKKYRKKRGRKDLYIEFNKLKEELQHYEKFSDNIEKQVQGVLESDILVEFDEELKQSFDIMLEEREDFIGRKISLNKKTKIKKEYLKYLGTTNLKLTLINTIYTHIFLFVISYLSVNLEKHVSDARYPQRTKYTIESDIVRISPTMINTMDMIIDDYYYLLSLNMPEDEE